MKMKYKNIHVWLVALAALFVCSCNDKWDEEQYEQYVSFKASSGSTVTRIRVKYKNDVVHYRLPLIVSGTTVNKRNLDVHVGLYSDTLQIYNREHFGEERKDLWYKEIDSSRYLFDPVTRIPSGEVSSLIDIQFNFSGIDFSDNWVLPLIIEDDPSYGYKSHPKLGYNNALLWLTPFNDYSGEYQATALNVYVEGDGNKQNLSTRNAYVVDENSIFFYAGAIEESREDRRFFKIKATFHPDTDFIPESNSDKKGQGTVTLEVVNNLLGLDFQVNGQPTYVIKENRDNERPVLLRRMITISDLSYTFNDPNETVGNPIAYKVTGSMSLQRNINTTIPDEEFAIEW